MADESKVRKKLIEVALPLEAINVASAREKSIRHGHPSTLHLWWARRPLAACRAVLFGQLVDDPSAWPERFRDEAAQDRERQRLFRLIEALVVWENSNDEGVIHAARVEIAQSIARGRRADDVADTRDDGVLAEPPPLRRADGKWDKPRAARAKVVDAYLAEVAPPVHDPFAGGGSIPLEAQRLGLRAIATDLNPVAVLINKALIEIPPKFAGWAPVNPDSRMQRRQDWKGAQGLAEDVRYYGKWMRDEAFKRIGHLYPEADLPKENGGGKATVIAWLWARTVASPDPAQGGAHVPLVSSFWLSKKPGKEAWIEPVVDRAARTWRFEVRTGKPADMAAVDAGTKTGRGDFACLLSGQPMAAAYIREQGQAGGLRDRLMAVVAEGKRGRLYLSPTDEQETTARVPVPDGAPDTDLPAQALGFRVQNYGMRKHRDLFTPRQLTALVTFSDLVAEARARVLADARAGGIDEGDGLEAGGGGARAYSEAVGVYLGLAVSRRADRWTNLSIWHTTGEKVESLIRLSAVPMTWEFTEANPLSMSTGNFVDGVALTATTLAAVPCGLQGQARQADASAESTYETKAVASTDPPYYDNVPYADLSDFFYVWLRRSLRQTYPAVFSTVLVPKAPELVADPYRHGGREAAERFFLAGTEAVLARLAAVSEMQSPTAIFYAFKQSELDREGIASTGWETFLEGTIRAGFAVDGTLPARTEQSGGLRNVGRNSLATSIVLVCRKRPQTAPTITRADFRRQLRAELPSALKALQHGNIAPVDMAQASIGPGMAIYSRCTRVLEADGTAMNVRTALQLINQALDEYLAEQEGEFDPDTRFALTWFETRAFDAGPYGEAETLAKARNVSVQGVAEAGILHAAAGKVRLYKRAELPADWDPTHDRRPTVWEAAQHLIKRLDEKGEAKAAELIAALGTRAAPARDLAYRLYNVCERKGWAEEGRAYNGLVIAWPELEKLAAKVAGAASGPAQRDLF